MFSRILSSLFPPKRECTICTEKRRKFDSCPNSDQHEWCSVCEHNLPIYERYGSSVIKRCPFCRSDILYYEEIIVFMKYPTIEYEYITRLNRVE